MPVIQVLEVGQGDCLIINPDVNCKFGNSKIFVDLGPGIRDVTKNTINEDNVNIFITHHHLDHMGGISFFANKLDCVKDIYLPFYQNEIVIIADCILNLKGVSSLKDCDETIQVLTEAKANQVLLKSLCESKSGPRIKFAYEGCYICNHIICLNPPLDLASQDWFTKISLSALESVCDDIFTPSFAKDIKIYINAMAKRNDERNVDSLNIRALTIFNDSSEIANKAVSTSKALFVIDFIMSNIELLIKFNQTPNRKLFRSICQKYNERTHDVCIVLKAYYYKKSFLLTGDASKAVFNRLISKGTDISADYLKMPHHGSRHNITNRILAAINPKIAIISHNNRRFGKSKDTHPNKAVLEMLIKRGIQIMLTNDVYKDESLYMERELIKDDYVEII